MPADARNPGVDIDRTPTDSAAALLAAAAPSCRSRSAVVGFDAFVDAIYRPVRFKDAAGIPVFFRTISEFADHLKTSAGRSGDLEIVLQEERLGGNAPLLALALAVLGVGCACAAPLGARGAEPAFHGLAAACDVVNLGAPARSTAFEFEDGKLMFGDAKSLHTLDWAAVEAAAGPGAFGARLRGADLVAVVDWSYLDRLGDILDGIERELDRDPAGARGTSLFFDLADPTTRSPGELRAFLLRLGRIAPRHRVALGLNEKEAAAAASALTGAESLSAAGPEADARAVRESAGIGEVVVHGLDYAVGADAAGTVRVAGRRVDRPRISTGGGDNFNAGYCLGLLAGLPMGNRLETATAASGFYVEQGRSATYDELVGAVAAQRGR